MKEQWRQQMQQKMADYQKPAPQLSWEDIDQALANRRRRARVLPLWMRRVAAAIVVMVLAGAGYWTLYHHEAEVISEVTAGQAPSDVKPTSAPASMPPVTHPIAQLRHRLNRIRALAVEEAASVVTDTIAVVAETAVTAQEERKDTLPMTRRPATTQYTPAVHHTSSRHVPSASNRLTAKVYLSNAVSGSQSLNSFEQQMPGYTNAFSPTGPGIDAPIDSNGNGASAIDEPKGDTDKKEQDVEGKTRSGVQNVGNTNENVRTAERVSHHHPIRFGLSLRYQLNDRWGVESGLTYTRLNSDITTEANGKVWMADQSLTYIGIPLSLNYRIWGNRHFSVYASMGGLVEKMVSGKLTRQGFSSSVSIHPLQFSLNGGMGGELKFNDWLSIFFEPGLSYYFDNGSSVSTYYQDKSLSVNLNVGLRIDVK